MFDFSPIQIMIVLAIALIVFGPKRLPELARTVGKGVREFKGAIAMEDQPASRPSTSQPAPPPAAQAATATTVAGPQQAASPEAAQPAALAEPEVLEGIVVSGDDQPPGAR